MSEKQVPNNPIPGWDRELGDPPKSLEELADWIQGRLNIIRKNLKIGLLSPWEEDEEDEEAAEWLSVGQYQTRETIRGIYSWLDHHRVSGKPEHREIASYIEYERELSRLFDFVLLQLKNSSGTPIDTPTGNGVETSSKKRYELLLAEFQKAWCRHGGEIFNVEIFAPSRIVVGFGPSLDQPPYDLEKYDLIAEVALPLDASREVTPDGENSTLFGYAVSAKEHRTAEALKTFTRLCEEAGAALPPEFRDRLAGLCPWTMRRPATWWLALLVTLKGDSARLPDGRYLGEVLWVRPFLLCVGAIERCRLNTDNPEFPERYTGDSASSADEDETTGGKTEQSEGEGGAGSGVPVPDLAHRDQLALQAMLEEGAYDSDHRLTTAQIVKKAEGNTADAVAYKEVMAKLKGLDYIQTKEGRSGGCWLTDHGRARAEKL